MRYEQFIGWTATGDRVTGTTTQMVYGRGAVGCVFRETQEWDARTEQWYTVLQLAS